jgi:hypothetical protein
MIDQFTIELRGLCASCARTRASVDRPPGSVARQLKADQAPANYGFFSSIRSRGAVLRRVSPADQKTEEAHVYAGSLNQSGAREVRVNRKERKGAALSIPFCEPLQAILLSVAAMTHLFSDGLRCASRPGW